MLWGGFAIFWELSVLRTGAPLLFVLWGIPFVLVGLYLIVGRFFADARMRARTVYGVTDERVIVISGLFQPVTRSVSLRTLGYVSLLERSDGSGTITLDADGRNAWMATTSWPGTRTRGVPALEGIPHARSVYETIRRAQRAAS